MKHQQVGKNQPIDAIREGSKIMSFIINSQDSSGVLIFHLFSQRAK